MLAVPRYPILENGLFLFGRSCKAKWRRGKEAGMYGDETMKEEKRIVRNAD